MSTQFRLQFRCHATNQVGFVTFRLKHAAQEGKSPIWARPWRGGPSSAGRGDMALFIQLANGTRPVGSASVNSKFSHLVNQRRSRQTQPTGRSALASDEPVGLCHCFESV